LPIEPAEISIARAKMVLHMARDCKLWRKNFRFYHCFGDEDSMKHLKSILANIILLTLYLSRCNNETWLRETSTFANLQHRHSESSASTPEISLDYAYDEAPIDQYGEQNQNVTGLIKKNNNIGMHVKHVFDRVNRLNQNMFVAHLCTTNISVVCPSKAEPASQEAAWDVSEVKKSGKNGSKQGCI